MAEDDGKPHTIHLSRNFYTLRVAETNESKVTDARFKTMVE